MARPAFTMESRQPQEWKTPKFPPPIIQTPMTCPYTQNSQQKITTGRPNNMSEELRNEEVLTTETPAAKEAAETPAAGAAPTAEAVETAPTESMADYASELEESYKAFDERRSQTYVPEGSPNAEKWQELRQMQADKTVVKVKIKEIVKGGAIAYLNETQAFIPASQISLEYVEKLEDWVGKYIEAYVITADPEKKRLVLSARELLKERRDEERRKKSLPTKQGTL